MNHTQNKNMPEWACRIDSYGRRNWDREKKFRSRRGEYIGAIISNLIFFWIVNHLRDWHLGFIKDNFMVVLWILNINILVQVAGNGLMLLWEVPVIRYLSRIVTESASFVTQLALFYIYPFDFTNFHGLSWLDWVLPIMLIIGMVASAMKVFSNSWKLLFWRQG
ncbi:MAG: hypothetical protein WCK34_06940 [Bacteroidota bacterium]